MNRVAPIEELVDGLLEKLALGLPLSVIEVSVVMTARGESLSRARVWQIEQRALKKLRRELTADG